MMRCAPSLRWLWARRWLLALNAFLLSPLMFYELRLDHGGPDRSLLFVLPASLLLLLIPQLLARRLWLVHLWLLPFYWTTAVDLYLIFTYDTRLSSSMMLVLLENLSDTADYVRAHVGKIAPAAVLLVAFHALGVWRLRKLDASSHKGPALAVFGAAIALYVAVGVKAGGTFFLFTHDRNTPFGALSQAYVAYDLHVALRSRAQEAEAFRFGASRESTPEEHETYVLVIGESSRPDHWGLYGYERDTTPRLDSLDNLVVFRDVVSQASITGRSVPLILTRGHALDFERATRERSLVSLLGEVGFDTYWFSAQQRDVSTGLINRFAAEADTRRFYERRHDTVIADHLLRELSRPASRQPHRHPSKHHTTRKSLAVIHTLGSHFHYPSRYPERFDVFDTRTSEPGATINAYDNTILHTDYFLSQLIYELQRLPGLKALLYVSDHGENLYDDDRHLFGHMLNTAYDLPVPMLAWFSREYAEQFPEKVEAAYSNADKPLSTRTVFHTMAHLVDAQLGEASDDQVDAGDSAGDDAGDAVRRLSALSPEVSCLPRMIVADPKPFDFDEAFGDAARRP